MNKLIVLILLSSLLLGLRFQVHYNVNPILSEYRAEYKAYLATLGNIRQQAELASLDGWERFQREAVRQAKAYKFPAQVLIAQGALESARGQSELAVNRNNFLGINAVDNNPDAAFSFESPEACVQYWVKMISKRYTDAWNNRHDPVKMVEYIKAGGYASAYNYVEKVVSQPEFNKVY
jgi:hypothetical protein